MESKKEIVQYSNTGDVVLTIRSIRDLVADLKELYPNPKSALALYNRLLQHIKDEELSTPTNSKPLSQGVVKFISGFQSFFGLYAQFLDSTELLMKNLPRGATIPYGVGDKIFIDIQKFLYQADEESRDIIRMHLLTIATVMEPDETALQNLNSNLKSYGNKTPGDVSSFLNQMGINTDSKEGAFMLNTVNEIQGCLAGQNTEDPTTAVMGLIPLLPKVMSQLKDGVADGSFDLNKIMNFKNIFAGMPVPEGAPSFENMSSMFAQAAQGYMGDQGSVTEIAPPERTLDYTPPQETGYYDEVD